MNDSNLDALKAFADRFEAVGAARALRQCADHWRLAARAQSVESRAAIYIEVAEWCEARAKLAERGGH